MDILENSPSTSTRAITSHVGISHSSVWWILHTNDMHLYHIQRVQLLKEDDFAPRLAFSRWYLEMRARDPRLLRVLFTDMTTFNRKDVFNSCNSHVWSTENLHATRTRAAQVFHKCNGPAF